MWWRRLAEVQTEHQNGEERRFEWLWTWNGCWCQMGWSEYLKNCWSTGIFTHNHLYGLQRKVWKIENIQWAAVVRTKMPCWCQRRMGRLVRDDREATVTQKTTHYNQGMHKIPSPNAQHVESWSRWATAAEDHTRCRSCQLRTGNGGYNSQKLTKIGQSKIEKGCLVWWVSISAATFRW